MEKKLNTVNEGISVKEICVTALSMALICISTMFIQVPIPLGYAHLGNAFIMLSASVFGSRVGLIGAGFGSALADLLTGYSMWIFPTLVIKSVMGLTIGKIAFSGRGRPFRVARVKVFVAVLLANSWMVIGYTISGAILYGSIAAGLASSPGLIAEGVVNILVFYVLGFVLEKSKALSYINR